MSRKSTETSPPTRLGSIHESAEKLNLTDKGLRAMVARRELPSVKVGRLRKIPLEAIDDYIAKHTTPAIDTD